LLILDDTKTLSLKALAGRLGTTTLSLASAERLQARLGVEVRLVDIPS